MEATADKILVLKDWLEEFFATTSHSIKDWLEESTTLYLVRHGQVKYNYPKGAILTNDSSVVFDPPLNSKGKEEAIKSGRKIIEMGWSEKDILLSSPRKRARESAELIAKTIGHPYLIVYYSFRDCGFTSAWPKEVVKSVLTDGQPEKKFMKEFNNDPPFLLSFAITVLHGLLETLLKYQGRRIALITHGEVIDIITQLGSLESPKNLQLGQKTHRTGSVALMTFP